MYLQSVVYGYTIYSYTTNNTLHINPFDIKRVCSSFISNNLCLHYPLLLCQTCQRFINVISVFKETVFGFIDFLYFFCFQLLIPPLNFNYYFTSVCISLILLFLFQFLKIDAQVIDMRLSITVFNSINFYLGTILATSHQFGYIIFSFLFILKYILISLRLLL